MQPIIAPIVPNAKGKEVQNLQNALSFFLDKNMIRSFDPPNQPTTDDLLKLRKLLQAESTETVFGTGTTQLVVYFQLQQKLGDNLKGMVEETTAGKMNELLKQLGGLDTTNSNLTYTVSGHIYNNNGAALPGFIAEVYIITADNIVAVARAVSDQAGAYKIIYSPGSADNPDIQVRAYMPNDPRNITSSVIKYNASANEVLDVVIEAAKVKAPAEFDQVVASITPHLGQLQLNNLKEDSENQQVTYLSNKTGWDGRITAMLASAHKLGDALKLNPAHVYALLRAGVPADDASIKSVSLQQAEIAIKNAVSNNIIIDDGKVPETIQNLNTLAVGQMLTTRPFAAVSTMDEMLGITLKQEQKNIFAQSLKKTGNNNDLWTELGKNGFTVNDISKLQLDGKLGYLTGQNANLVKKVYDKYSLKTDTDLASRGLYKAAEWKNIIGTDVPPDITADEYAMHLATQVKLSYPTAVAGAMIKNGEINLGANVPLEELASFFDSNQSKNIIGTQPVKTWDGFKSLTTTAKAAVASFERLYQISPSDESMAVLAKIGITSSYQLAKYTKSEFLTIHGQDFPSLTEAEMAYTKSNEVYSSSLGIATSYLTAKSMPNVYSVSGQLEKAPDATIAFPTLEDLLGNMDYCSCDHCKSVLSPAAYLVELLQFIDLDYLPKNPINTLRKRRADIENIQLSCENTNMALPYIDLVNEILEYYIINNVADPSLSNLKGHDVTEDTQQTELLAEPQYVSKEAYDELKTKVFPYNLPFNQPLETLRKIFQIWDLDLERMLSILATPLASRKEALGLNNDEYKTLTDVTFKALPEYFGEPAGNSIAQLNAVMANGKTFTRRVDISYEDLVSMLTTNFINPGYSVVPLFEKLQISIADLDKFYKGTLSDGDMDNLIPAEIVPGNYGGDIKQWLRDRENVIMGLITLTDMSAGETPCDFAAVELRYALPDNVNNQLKAIDYQKFNRFLRLLKKTGWTITMLDAMITAFLPVTSGNITEANIDATFVTLLGRISNFKKIARLINYSEKKYPGLLVVADQAVDGSIRETSLAKIIKISLPELAALTSFTGIDPFANDLDADEPGLMKFIKIVQQLKLASLKIADLAYLLQHNDITGKLILTKETLLKNIKSLGNTLSNIEKENTIAPDNADFNFAKAKMLLVYDPSTTDEFFGLLTATKTFTAPFITIEEGLPGKIIVADGKIGFDPFKKQITYSGILSAANKTLIENAADALVPADMGSITLQPDLDTFIADFKTAVGVLFTATNVELASFANDYPELKIIYDNVTAELTPAAQTQKLVELILPGLIAKLKYNGLRQNLTAILKSDADTVAVLTSTKEITAAAGDNTKMVLDDFISLQEKIVFDQDKTYSFYVDPPSTDDYLLYVAATQNTIISLTIDGVIIINNVTIGADKEVKNAAPVSLAAGVLHEAILVIASLPGGEQAQLSWRTKGIEKSVIPDNALYTGDKVDFAGTSLIRLSKAAQIQNLFHFTPGELNYFSGENVETKNFINELDTDGSISAPNLMALWNKIRLLAGFNIIKNENEPEENTWLQVLRDPSVKNAQNKLLLEYFNLWQEADVTAVLTNFVINRSEISKLSVLWKIVEVMNTLSSVYYPAADVVTWVTNDPSYDLVTTIKNTIRLKVTDATWLDTMQTVSDPVRNLLRDALVAYILQYKKPSPEIINPDKLYEYFLVDVEMDACMKTSRIRLALSTLQLFIQRCMMNLEPDVDPSSIRADQWAWMKRYRVWEANRKVFLYPENWLEPELRDNKSSLFKELEGELLQSEITDDSAETAFLNYLKKLDDIAKLEMVGMYLEENEAGNQDDDVLHVIGRTNGHTRQYYYRRYEYGYWTPWEKISLTIE
ncbi:MAG: neuraminidase-like domain-containing protein, partial [Ginsengibacter sp.]